MPVIGQIKTFDKEFLFQIEIDGFLSAAFSKCSELECDVGVIKHYEGGSLLPTKSFGKPDFKDIALERGATVDLDFYTWFSEIVNAAANAGVVEAAGKRHFDIVQRDRDGSILKRWSVFGAFPTKFTAGNWDNSSDNVVIEKMTLAYDYFIRTF